VLKDVDIRVGSLGVIRFSKGLYAYVGSGKGPGGIIARVLRHKSKSKRLWWHIDYLTTNPYVRIVKVFTTNCSESLVAEVLSKHFSYIPKIGSSDDLKAPSHLFRIPNVNSLEVLKPYGCVIEELKV